MTLFTAFKSAAYKSWRTLTTEAAIVVQTHCIVITATQGHIQTLVDICKTEGMATETILQLVIYEEVNY